MSNLFKHNYSRGSTWILVIYLSIMVSGCATRPAELSPEAARALQTRVYSASLEQVARAATVVLQDMHYTLGQVDMSLGVLTASRNSEWSLAPISREISAESEMADELGTFCLIAGVMAAVGLTLAWIFGGDDDEEEDDRDERRSHRSRSHSSSRSHSHNSSSFFFGSSDDNGPDSYTYTMTINMEELSSQQTQIRVTVQGEHFEGSSLVESGPVQDSDFFNNFYNQLQIVLNR